MLPAMIAAGKSIDLVADTDCDQVPSDGYNDGKGRITVVTFLHKRVFRPKALVVNIRKIHLLNSNMQF